MAEQLLHENARIARAEGLFYPQANHAEIRSVELGDIGENHILIQSLNSGISRGTESLVWAGNVPHKEWNRMKCPHQLGDFSFPVSYGYALVGRIKEKGAKVEGLDIGDTVFALHPHHSFAVVDAAMANKVPTTIPPSRAVLAANMETALNGCWDAGLEPGFKVAVIGGGVVGLLTAYVAKTMIKGDVTIVDINSARKTIAERMGLDFAHPDQTPGDCDIVFHTSASEAGLQSALDMAAFEGRIVEMSWYGDKTVNLSLGGAFHSKRLQIHSSQVGHVSASRRAHTSHKDRMQQALDLLDDPALDCLLDSAIPLKDLPTHLPEIFSPQSETLCQVITYP